MGRTCPNCQGRLAEDNSQCEACAAQANYSQGHVDPASVPLPSSGAAGFSSQAQQQQQRELAHRQQQELQQQQQQQLQLQQQQEQQQQLQLQQQQEQQLQLQQQQLQLQQQQQQHQQDQLRWEQQQQQQHQQQEQLRSQQQQQDLHQHPLPLLQQQQQQQQQASGGRAAYGPPANGASMVTGQPGQRDQQPVSGYQGDGSGNGPTTAVLSSRQPQQQQPQQDVHRQQVQAEHDRQRNRRPQQQLYQPPRGDRPAPKPEQGGQHYQQHHHQPQQPGGELGVHYASGNSQQQQQQQQLSTPPLASPFVKQSYSGGTDVSSQPAGNRGGRDIHIAARFPGQPLQSPAPPREPGSPDLYGDGDSSTGSQTHPLHPGADPGSWPGVAPQHTSAGFGASSPTAGSLPLGPGSPALSVGPGSPSTHQPSMSGGASLVHQPGMVGTPPHLFEQQSGGMDDGQLAFVAQRLDEIGQEKQNVMAQMSRAPPQFQAVFRKRYTGLCQEERQCMEMLQSQTMLHATAAAAAQQLPGPAVATSDFPPPGMVGQVHVSSAAFPPSPAMAADAPVQQYSHMPRADPPPPAGQRNLGEGQPMDTAAGQTADQPYPRSPDALPTPADTRGAPATDSPSVHATPAGTRALVADSPSVHATPAASGGSPPTAVCSADLEAELIMQAHAVDDRNAASSAASPAGPLSSVDGHGAQDGGPLAPAPPADAPRQPGTGVDAGNFDQPMEEGDRSPHPRAGDAVASEPLLVAPGATLQLEERRTEQTPDSELIPSVDGDLSNVGPGAGESNANAAAATDPAVEPPPAATPANVARISARNALRRDGAGVSTERMDTGAAGDARGHISVSDDSSEDSEGSNNESDEDASAMQEEAAGNADQGDTSAANSQGKQHYTKQEQRKLKQQQRKKKKQQKKRKKHGGEMERKDSAEPERKRASHIEGSPSSSQNPTGEGNGSPADPAGDKTLLERSREGQEDAGSKEGDGGGAELTGGHNLRQRTHPSYADATAGGANSGGGSGGGTAYRKGPLENLVDPAKGQNNRETKGNKNAAGAVANKPSFDEAAARRESVLVTIHALISPEWKLAKNEFLAVLSEVSNWKIIDGYATVVGECGPKGVFRRIQTQMYIPIRLAEKQPRIGYKFIKVIPGYDSVYEVLELGRSSNGFVNRCLDIPRDSCFPGGEFVKYDNVVRAPSSRGYFTGLFKDVKDFISGSSRGFNERKLSMEVLLPCLDFSDRGSYFEQIDTINQAYLQLSNPHLLEDVGRRYHHQWKIQDFNASSVAMEVVIAPSVKSLAETQLSMEPSQRVLAGLAVCLLVNRLGQILTNDQINEVATAMILEVDGAKQELPQLDGVLSYTDKAGRRELAAALIHFINMMRSVRRRTWEYLMLVPLVHFLRGDSTPFEPRVSPAMVSDQKKKPELWWGLDFLKGDITFFDDRMSLSKAAEQIRPLLAADCLLQRAVLHKAGLFHIVEAAKLIRPSPGVLLHALQCFANKGSSSSQFWGTIFHCVEEVLPLLNVWLDNPSLQRSADMRLALVIGATKQASALLQTLGQKTVYYSDRVPAQKCLVGVLTTVFSLFPRQHAASVEKQKETEAERAQGGSTTEEGERGPADSTVEAMDTDGALRKTREVDKALFELLHAVTATTMKFALGTLEQPEYLESRDDLFMKEVKFWNTLVKFDGLAELGMEAGWIDCVRTWLDNRLDKIRHKHRIHLLGALETDHFLPVIRGVLSQATADSLENLIRSGDAEESVFKALHGRRGGDNLLSKLLHDFVSKKVNVSEEKQEDAMLDNLLTWNCWPSYIRHFWVPAGGSRPSIPRLREEAADVLQRGMSALETLLERFANNTITVRHVRTSEKYRSQLVRLCEEIDKLHKTAKPSSNTQYAGQVEAQLKDALALIKELEIKQAWLIALFRMCATIGVDVPDGERLREVVQSSITERPLNELQRLFAYSPDVAEMLPPFQVACTIALFQELCHERCKVVRNDEQMAPSARLSLSLDVIAKRIYKPVMDQWYSFFKGTYEGTLELRLVDYCFQHGNAQELLECMAASCSLAKLAPIAMTKSRTWMKGRVVQIHDFFEVMRVSKVAQSIKTICQNLDLKGDFSDVDFICSQTSDELRKSPLSAITKAIVDASVFLKRMSPLQMECLEAFAKCNRLVEWLRKEVKELRELKTFVDLASIATSEGGDMDADRISYLHTSCTGYAGLIYQLPQSAGFKKFMEACEPAFRALEGDVNLPKKLLGTQQSLGWLKSVRESQESVTITSFVQAEAINSRGKYIIKVPDVGNEELPTLDKCIELRIPKRDGEETMLDNRTYRVENIKDLHSKLVLVGGKRAEQGRGLIKEFMEVFEGVLRVAEALVTHCAMGSTQYLDWSKEYVCGDGTESKCVEVIATLRDDAMRLEGNLQTWTRDMQRSREIFYQLNFFTMRQLILLRKELSLVANRGSAVAENIHPQVFALLSSLKPNVQPGDIRSAVISGLGSSALRIDDIMDTALSHRGKRKAARQRHGVSVSRTSSGANRFSAKDSDDDEEQTPLENLMSLGYIERVALAALQMHKDDFAEALKLAKMMRGNAKLLVAIEASSAADENEEEMAMDTDSSLSAHVPGFVPSPGAMAASFSSLGSAASSSSSSTSSGSQYLTLEKLGRVLFALHKLTKPKGPSAVPQYITQGKPNLIVVPESDVFGTVLDLYRHDSEASLPTSSEVLVCTAETTAEEVVLLWRRAIFSTRLHCLVNADKLDYSVSSEVISELRALRESVQTHYTECNTYALAIVCCRENEEHTWILAALEEFRTQSTPCIPQELRKYLLQMFRSLGGKALTLPDGRPWHSGARADSDESCVRLVTSTRAGVGKSLHVRRMQEQLAALDVNKRYGRADGDFTHSIPVQGNAVNVAAILDMLNQVPHSDQPISRLIHIDVAPTVQSGMDTFLFNLLILGTLSDRVGRVWQRSPTDLYVVEATCDETAFSFLSAEINYMSEVKRGGHSGAALHKARLPFYTLLPVHLCGTPLEAYSTMMALNGSKLTSLHPQLDRAEFCSRQFQRVFGYLTRHTNNDSASLDRYSYAPGQNPGSPLDCLQLLLSNCGTSDPSWLVLHHFVHFLDAQLADCEKSVFCNMMLVGEELAGFRAFVVRFLLRMSVDFATPSLEVAADVQDAAEKMFEFALRRRWEQCPHPYLFFNSDGVSMTFVGFNVEKNGNLVAQEGQVLEEGIMSRRLHTGLRAQGVELQENFQSWSRQRRLECLCKVLGQEWPADVDSSYELTLDNVKKILAIQMRFRCGIPVVVMGETGCGKTRLIRFMCQLQAGVDGPKNMLIMKIHGGTTEEHVQRRVEEAEVIARRNSVESKIDTVLFFDEANTSNALGMIKEVMCDQRINGRAIARDTRLRFIAACNPYRRHTDEMIHRLEEAGLGYHVRATETEDKLGRIPLRQLVYRVHPLPGSMSPLVWDFGQLNTEVEKLYVHQIVLRYVCTQQDFPEAPNLIETITSVLAASQAYMREQKDECSFVSLRDVERAMLVMKWFYWLLGDVLQEMMQAKEDLLYQLHVPDAEGKETELRRPPPLTAITRSLLLSLGVCYQARLRDRGAYRAHVAQMFTDPCPLSYGADQIEDEINRCQEVFLDQLQLGPNIAKNKALRENVFMMVVCIDTRIPLFLVGKPGSSKSLAKTEVADAMQGDSSNSPLFRRLKQVHMVSYQCSPLSTPSGIVGTFKQCQQFQKDKNLTRFVAAVVLDEVGLAEDSPRLPLKALHPLLEDGTGGGDDDNLQSDDIVPISKRVAFVGISNWALDPAKMNRGIMVLRGEPDGKELETTADQICATDASVKQHINPLINSLAKAYRAVYKDQEREFFGLRDFYSLVKMVYSVAASQRRTPQWPEVEIAVRRNFGGMDADGPVSKFRDLLARSGDVLAEGTGTQPVSTLDLIQASLHGAKSEHYHGDSRYLLILSENCDAALEILQNKVLHNEAVVIFGSSFPKDQEYTQVCRDINRIKVCMETGKTVVLLNLENLYESLYDALNQSFVNLGGEKYVDLGLGTHRVKCRVDSKFRLIVIAKRRDVQERFPIPLINRLEKHFLALSTVLSSQQAKMAANLQRWVKQFSEVRGSAMKRKKFTEGDAFTGYHRDTAAALIIHASEDSAGFGRADGSKQWRDTVMARAKYLLMMMCPPDAVARLPHTELGVEAKSCWDIYFDVQHHESLLEYLQVELQDLQVQAQQDKPLSLQVTTHARLLANVDAEKIREQLRLPENSLHCLLLQQFHTENQFCREVSNFFVRRHDVAVRSRLLIVQCDEGDQHSDLLACARHRLHEEREKALKANLQTGQFVLFHVIFIIQLPRKAGGCFEGAQGGLWRSVHIDELRPSTALDTPNVTSLVGRSISGLFQTSIKAHFGAAALEMAGLEKAMDAEEPEAMETTELPQQFEAMDVSDPNVCILSLAQLLSSCIQEAISRLDDIHGQYEEVESRIRNRIFLFQSLLKGSETATASTVGKQFLATLTGHILKLLKERDGLSENAKNWVQNEALATGNLHAGGTFQRALWLKLQAIICPFLSEVIGIFDCSTNFDLLADSKPEWLRQLWLDLFVEPEVISLDYQRMLVEDSSQMRDRVPVLACGAQNHTFACELPFSWRIKSMVDGLMVQATSTSTNSGQPIVVCLRDALLATKVGKKLREAMERNPRAFLHYMGDYVRMTHHTPRQDAREIVNKALLTAQNELHAVDQLQPVYDVASVHVAHARVQARLHCMLRLLSCVTNEVMRRSVRAVTDDVPELIADLLVLRCTLVNLTPTMESVSSAGECHRWLESIRALSSPIDSLLAALERDGRLGERATGLLQKCRPLWARLNAVRLFLEHVTLVCQNEPYLFYATLKLFHSLPEDTDFRRESSMANVIAFLKGCVSGKFDMQTKDLCGWCQQPPVNGNRLTCSHPLCIDCLARVVQEAPAKCPVCQKDIPSDARPSKKELAFYQQQVSNTPAFKEQSNKFFMDLVSSLCFSVTSLSTSLVPEPELMELLLSMVSGHNTIRSLSPFEDHDEQQQTVVRSFLLQLLLRFSENQVFDHVRQYLETAQRFSDEPMYNDELCLLFVHCLEDALHSHWAELKDRSGEGRAIKMVLDTVARAQEALNEAKWDEAAAKVTTLQAVAGARFALTYGAEHMCKMLTSQSAAQNPDSTAAAGGAAAGVEMSREWRVKVDNLIHQIQSFCADTESKHNTVRVFLVKQIVRRVGLDTFRQAMDEPDQPLAWIMPDQLRRGDDEEVIADRFLLLGDRYVKIREATASSALDGKTAKLQEALKVNTRGKRVVSVEFILAIYREVTMCRAEVDSRQDQLDSATPKLKEYVQRCDLMRKESKELAALLIDNEQGAALPEMRVSVRQSGTVRTLSALVVHFVAMLTECAPRNKLMEVFSKLAFNPASMHAAFLPTMPEDHLQDVRAAMSGAWFECPKGHPYFISECGQPMQDYQCPDCGSRIGGGQHRLHADNRTARADDRTQLGHVLGMAAQRSRAPVPERDLNPATNALMRVLLHLSLVWAASSADHAKLGAVAAMIRPGLPAGASLGRFFWDHLSHDVHMFAASIGKGVDFTLLALHRLLESMTSCKANTGTGVDLGLSNRTTRRRWEKAFEQEFLAKFLGNVDEGIVDAQQRMMNDKRLGNDKLMRAVFEVDAQPGGDAERAYLLPRLWRYRVRASIDGLMHILGPQKDKYPLLHTFLQHEHLLRAVQFLPEIVQLQRRLVDRYSRRIDRKTAEEYTVKTFLAEHGEAEMEQLGAMITAYEDAWMLVREPLYQHGRLKPGEEWRYGAIKRKSPLTFLLPTTEGYGRNPTALVDFLVSAHNEFLEAYGGVRGMAAKDFQRVQLFDATHAQLISYDANRHLLPLVLSHCHYTVEAGQGMLVQYDLGALEKHIEQRFVVGRPMVDMAEVRLVFSEDVHNTSQMMALRRRIPQCELPKPAQHQIAGEIHELRDVCTVISNLEIAIGFLTASGGSGTTVLADYLDQVLKMGAEASLVSRKLRHTCQLQHLLSAWRLLVVLRTQKLMDCGQDAFENVADGFKAEIDDDALRGALRDWLAQLPQRDAFIGELLEFIVVELNERHTERNSAWGDWALTEAMDQYGCRLDGLDDMPYELECQHAIAVWIFAARLSRTVSAADGRYQPSTA